MATQSELLTTAEVGHILGKRPRTVQRMVAAGKIPHAKKLPGNKGAFLFYRSDIEAVLAEMTEATA